MLKKILGVPGLTHAIVDRGDVSIEIHCSIFVWNHGALMSTWTNW